MRTISVDLSVLLCVAWAHDSALWSGNRPAGGKLINAKELAAQMLPRGPVGLHAVTHVVKVSFLLGFVCASVHKV